MSWQTLANISSLLRADFGTIWQQPALVVGPGIAGTLDVLTFLPLKGPPASHWSGEQHAFSQKVRRVLLEKGVIAVDGCCDCHYYEEVVCL